MMNMTKECKLVRLANSAAAGVTTITTSIFNNQGNAAPGSYTNWTTGGTVAPTLVPTGFDAICIVVALNTVVATGVITVTLQDNSLNQTGGMADVVATSAVVSAQSALNETAVQKVGGVCGITFTDVGGLSSNGLIVLDIALSQLQYYQVTLARSVANITLDGVFGILYRGKQRPVIQDTTVQAQGIFVASS